MRTYPWTIQINKDSVKDWSASNAADKFVFGDTFLLASKIEDFDYVTNSLIPKDFTLDGGNPQALRVLIRKERDDDSTLYSFQDQYNQGYLAGFGDLIIGQVEWLVALSDPQIEIDIEAAGGSLSCWLEISYLDGNSIPSTIVQKQITIVDQIDNGAAGTPPPSSPTYLTAAEVAAAFISKDGRMAWACISATTGTPPALTGSGDAYIIPASGTTGAWVGQEGKIAVDDNTWTYYTPAEAWSASVTDTPAIYQYISGVWTEAPYVNSGAPEIGEALEGADVVYGTNNSTGSRVTILMSRILTYVQAGISLAASVITFVNTTTQMVATNVQTAIDELYSTFISYRSTSHNYGGELSINGGDNTKFDVAAGQCYIMDGHTDPANPTFVKVSWPAFSAQTVTGLATQAITFISIKKGVTVPADGELLQTASAPTGEDRRDYNVLGILVHDNLTNITVAKTTPLLGQDATLVVNELSASLGGTFNRIPGNDYSENGANLKIDKSSGEMFGDGYNWGDNKKNPNIVVSAQSLALTFSLFHRGSAVPSVTSDIDPNNYDPQGAGLVTVKTGWFTCQRIYFDPATESTIVQYGQFQYDSLKKAVDGALYEVYEDIAATTNFNCRSILVVQQGSTTLDSDLTRKFLCLGVLGCRGLSGIPTMSRFVEPVEVVNALSYERQSITLLESGGIIYAEIESTDGGDMTYAFKQREYTLDCTTGAGAGGKAQVALTAGSATVPQKNWVYVTLSGDVAVIAASTTEPSGEYAMIATCLLPDVTTFNSRDAYGSRRWTESKDIDGRGVISWVLRKLRRQPLDYISGLLPTPDFATANEVDLTIASGVVQQIYDQVTDALQVTVDGALVVNDETTPYTPVLDLADITTDANGGSLTANNTYYQLTIAISTNTDGSTQMVVNKPTGSYATAQNAFNDINGYSVTAFPSELDTCSLVCSLVIRYQVAGGGTYENAAQGFGVDFIDLRGVTPGSASSGSGAAAVSSFSDAAFNLFNSVDATKILNLTLAAITTATTRTWTVLNKDITVQGEDSDGNMIIPGTGTSAGDAILQLDSTTKGFAGPRMTTTERNAITGLFESLEIYNLTTQQKEVYNGSTWVAVGPAGTGEANTASNVGGFTQVFKQKAGVDLEFRTLQSSDSSVSLTQNTSDVDLKVVKTAPYRILPIPAGAMAPRATNGAESGSQELATNDINLDFFDFDAATDEAVQVAFMMPDEWDRLNVKFKFIWKDAATAGSGNVVWGARAVATSNDDPLDTAFGTSQTVTDGFITSGDNHTTPATSAVTVGGTPALGDLVVFEFYRDADDAADTYTQDARLIGVAMQYKESATEPVIW